MKNAWDSISSQRKKGREKKILTISSCEHLLSLLQYNNITIILSGHNQHHKL